MKFIRPQHFRKVGRVPMIAAFAFMLATTVAFAHAHPVTMLPAPDQTVSVPDVVKITFSEAVEPKFSKISVTDTAGHGVSKETSVVAADAKTITVVLPKLPTGVYIVNRVAVAVDSHRERGNYKFTVK